MWIRYICISLSYFIYIFEVLAVNSWYNMCGLLPFFLIKRVNNK